MLVVSGTAEDRFWDKVRIGDGCWEWAGARGRYGHGVLMVGSKREGDKRMEGAHRIAWEIANGEIPMGLHVCHHCDNPPCVRYDHLFIGTPADNLADMRAKGRQARGATHGLRLHPEASAKGSANGMAKLSWDSVREIRLLAKSGASSKEIAKRFGVWRETINAIRRGALWKGDGPA
jgi:DNA-binding CsgD family transcriptional regulator